MPTVATILASTLTTALAALGPAATSPGGGAVWPVSPGAPGTTPPVVEPFAPPTSAWGPGHRGVDLLAQGGQRVVAARDGRVTFAGRLAGRGVVVVSHGATRTTYEPVNASVRPGQTVETGQPLGRLELHAGSHCWPRACLHWGLIEGERYLDPLSLLTARRVRLLPLTTSTRSIASPAPLVSGAAPQALPALKVGSGGEAGVRRVGVPVGRPAATDRW